jgi:hypothetical protein
MAKTRFRGFSVKKQGFRGLSARNQGLNIIAHINPRFIPQKTRLDLWWEKLKSSGA